MSASPPADRPLRWQEAVIEAIVRRTPRVVSVFLRADLGAHVAGQHVDVRLTAPDGYRAERSYSIVSAPGRRPIELAIERLENGEVSPYFHEAAEPGDMIEIRGPIGGHFVWRREDGGPLLLVAGGSGVAPLMSMLRQRADAVPRVAREIPALLVYSARRWEEIIFRDELVAAESGATGFAFVAITTREAPRRPADFGRRLDRALLAAILGRWGRRPACAYVCGGNGFVEAATAALVDEGLAPETIRAERYGGA